MKILINVSIFFIITFSAFAVIFIKHQNRIMNIEIENIGKTLSIEINKHKELLNARAILLDRELVKKSFKENLGMIVPPRNKIIYLDLAE
ncbi:MAG: cell division protein FtsL [Pseudomonadota bacterium]|nr:cell division protein FtsL [Pseudomonadota bacterium]